MTLVGRDIQTSLDAMQIIITHGTMARSKVLHFTRTRLLLAVTALALTLLVTSGAAYHLLFVTAVRDNWPVVSQLVRWVVRDEAAQRERFMRENLDALAQRLGEVQAKLVKLEAIGERVTGLAGVAPAELAPLKRTDGGGKGGIYLPLDQPTSEQFALALDLLDEAADQHADVFTLVESRLLESQLRSLLVPSAPPVQGPVGSPFGFRADPFTGRMALHSGLDYPAEVGTPILAAAGGVVITAETHPEYGLMLVLDHGNSLSTRYAHASRLDVKVGDIVRRGQRVAAVGNTGRSTGPHLHFEVLLGGVPQNPARFLAGGGRLHASRR